MSAKLWLDMAVDMGLIGETCGNGQGMWCDKADAKHWFLGAWFWISLKDKEW